MTKKWVNIADVLFFQEGPGVRNTQYTTSGVKLLNVANLVDGKVDLSKSDRYISEEEAYGKYRHFLCDDGDFVIASSGIKVEYIDKKMGFVDASMLPLCMNSSTIRFKVLDENQLRIRYFMYYLKSKHFKEQLTKQITGSAQLNYGPSHLKKMIMPLIDITVQDEIISCMDKLHSIIETRQRELIELDRLMKARFVELFGDIRCNNKLPLVKLSEFVNIGSSKRIYANEYVDKGVPFYRSKEIRELGTGMKPSVELYIKQERYDEIKEKYGVPKKGDILIAAIGATIGYSWIVDTDTPFYYKDGNLIILSIKNNVNPIFLNYTMRILIEDFKNKDVAGSAQLALTIEKLEKMMVVNPDIKLQNQFADFVHQVNKSKFDTMTFAPIYAIINLYLHTYFYQGRR